MRVQAEGLGPECKHALRLLPIIDFSYTFVCNGCGGTVSTGWPPRAGHRTVEDGCRFLMGQLSAILGVECTFTEVAQIDPEEDFERLRTTLARWGVEWPFPDEEDENA